MLPDLTGPSHAAKNDISGDKKSHSQRKALLEEK
jgi:hypothetical protein